MQHDEEVLYDDERRAFAQLPREAEVSTEEADRMVRRLRAERLLQPRVRVRRRVPLAAAAVLIFAAGVSAGSFMTRRGSLEDALARKDLSVDERILLLQRAGSAYVRAAQGYADATARVDSTAVEVASSVLVGAANAVARSNLDAGIAARLAAALQSSGGTPVTPAAAQRKPVIWF